MTSNKQKDRLELEVAKILFDLGKEIKILKIDRENTILDVPYTEYIKKIINIADDIYQERKENV